MLDPAEVAARDELMKAAIRNPALAVKPPPEPRLGDGGAYQANDPNAGHLSVQGRVGRDGREGLFDDVVGKGWQLLLRGGETPVAYDDRTRAAIRQLAIVVADFGRNGDTDDIDGSYTLWLDRLGADVVLVRPDFYIFGTSPLTGLGALVSAARDLFAPVAVVTTGPELTGAVS